MGFASRKPLLVIVGIVILLSGWVGMRRTLETEEEPTRRNNTESSLQASATPTAAVNPTIQDFGSPTTWPYFNRDYRSSREGWTFRFRYPPGFGIKEWSSGGFVAVIKKEDERDGYTDEDDYFLIMEGFTLAHPGHVSDKAFVDFLSGGPTPLPHPREKWTPPDLTKAQRVDVGRGNFFYKFPNAERPYGRDEYLGVIDKHGVYIVDPRKLPQEIIYRIIQSIEFD